MHRRKVSFVLDSTISSSILTFVIGMLGNTNIQLSEWWHYLLAVFALVGIFIFFFVVTEIAVNVWKKYFQRADISTNENTEIGELRVYIKALHEKHFEYQTSNLLEYQNVLIQEIAILYSKATDKLNLIKRYSSSKTLKNKFVVNNVALIKSYEQFCSKMKEIYKL